jgi:hypothetical protein
LSIYTCKFSPATPLLVPPFSFVWTSLFHINYTTEGGLLVCCHSQSVPIMQSQSACLLFTYLLPAFEYLVCLNLVASFIKQSQPVLC